MDETLYYDVSNNEGFVSNFGGG